MFHNDELKRVIGWGCFSTIGADVCVNPIALGAQNRATKTLGQNGHMMDVNMFLC